MNYIIYKIENVETGKVYIGKTSQKLSNRWSEHKSTLRKASHHSDLFIKEFKEYGEDAFNISTIETVYNEQEANLKERQYIKLFNTITPNGYNSQSGGDKGRKDSDEANKKKSEAQKGEKAYNYGKKLSKETCLKMSKSRTGDKNHIYKDYPRIVKMGVNRNKKQYALKYKTKVLKRSIDKEYLESLIDSGEYLELYKEKYGDD